MDRVEERLREAKKEYDRIPIPSVLPQMTREVIADMGVPMRKSMAIWKKGLMAAAAFLLATGGLYTGITIYQQNQEQKQQLSQNQGMNWEDMEWSDWELLRQEVSNAVADAAAGNEIRIGQH